jgi:hypothetical protein
MDYDYNYLQRAEIRHESSAQDSDIGEKLLADSRGKPTQKDSKVHLSDVGEIKGIDLPSEWKELPQHQDEMRMSRSRDFVMPGGGELSFYERGARISEHGGKNFRNILDKPLTAATGDRNLDHEELASLKAVLQDMGNENKFRVESARVSELNGKRVLTVAGEKGQTDDSGSFHSSGVKMQNTFVDKFGDGQAIQEIRLQAKPASMGTYEHQLGEALKTLSWK